MRSFLIIILVAYAGLMAACKKSVIGSRLELQTIPLNACADYIFSNDQVRVCFDAVISDSRCPAGAMCIWQGTATCKFSFFKNDISYPITLSTLSMPGMYNKDTIIAGYKIEFIDLLPYPGLPPVPAPGNKIKAEVKVIKL